ncbi:YaeQ family protein [Aquincola sp. S2]|uniref:YaeQ family protein n=1 Tax=Pseudaquabacterium terrae TaxID=2732868 RepID=A0ABX2EHC6_9BURK|nr:YaeQ family protein [Aquabacterium terrae]NRF67989.1 YaeQ family protein [Aquabacterium terrae]
MALKSTIYKANLHLADMDRGVYGEHALTLALHPSETEERLMVRVLAFALHLPPDDQRGNLQFARGLSDTDEPDLWQKDLTDQIVHWIEVGQPDERRLAKACGKSERVTIYAYGSAAPIWWAGIETKVTRLRNLEVWRLLPEQAQALAGLAQRSMQLQVQVQDGHVWISNDLGSVELQPQPLWRPGH